MRRKDQGVALIAVLWVVLLLTVMATAIATRTAEGRWVAARARESASLAARADSAIRLALARLIANVRVLDHPIPVQNTLRIADDQVEVVVEQESAKLDLNTADEVLLLAYFRAAGWEAQNAQGFVNRLGDWRDADDAEREGGLERDGYAALGAKGLPRNGPFETVEEIRQIPGASNLTPELFDGLTVYSHLSVPIGKMSQSVERALKLADELKLGGRVWSNASQADDSERNLAGSVVRVRACARRVVSSRCREALVRLTGGTTEPIQVFVWKDAPGSRS